MSVLVPTRYSRQTIRMDAPEAGGKIVGPRKANIVSTIAASLVIGAMSAFTISPAPAQPAGKMFRIGYLNPTSQSTSFLPVFRHALGELGYLEGKNLVLEERYAEDQPERLSPLATELVDLNVAALVTFATPATLAAKRATSTIPIVMIVGEPVSAGIVPSLNRPGGNITGQARSRSWRSTTRATQFRPGSCAASRSRVET